MENTVNIFVSLDTDASANPHVILTVLGGGSGRNEVATSGDTITWKKKDNNDNFKITCLAPTGENQAFSVATISGNGKSLSSEYQPTSSDPNAEFSYTLTVDQDGTSYDTTITSSHADDDRPVIRN